MTAPKRPPRQRPQPNRRQSTAKKPVRGKAQRRYNVRNPVTLRAPVVRNKRRRPKRSTTFAVGSVLVAVISLAVYLAVSLVAAVVTGLIAGVVTGIATAVSEPGHPQQQPVRPSATGKPAGTNAPKAPSAGVALCNAPIRGGGTCSRPTTVGRNCGIKGHPAPRAA